LYAGIDWADQKHDGLVLDEAGQKLGSIRVPHTPEGLDKLDAWLASMLGGQSKDQMTCIIETNHGLLISFLLEHEWPVYPVNPRTVDRKRSASGAKTDAIDAYRLSKTGRADFADLHRLTPVSRKDRRTQGTDA
jgi:transposase